MTRIDLPRQRRFQRGGPESDAEQKLVELFQNRAQLKKEFDELKAEHDALKERMEEQEESASKSGELSEAVEEFMGDPTNGINVTVYCQLRKLWRICHQDLETLKEDLARKQLEAEQKKHEEAVQQKQGAQLAAIDRSMSAIGAELKAERRSLEELQSSLGQLTGIFNYFARKGLEKKIPAQQVKVEELQARFDDISGKRDEAMAREGTEFGGVSTKGKRMVNLAVLARAQQLYIYFMDHDLASMAASAQDKAATDASYGDYDAARLLSTQIEQKITGMDHAKLLTRDLLKERVQSLKGSAEYASEGQSYPDKDGLDYITRDARSDTALTDRAPIPANVLEKDFWSLSEVLL